MIDLPAPVSPVKVVRPGLNSRSRCWIMAKFSMRSSVSIGLPDIDAAQAIINRTGHQNGIQAAINQAQDTANPAPKEQGRQTQYQQRQAAQCGCPGSRLEQKF